MALRLRRGTDAQRLTLDGISLPVPAEGELIYTTDTKKLFVGDGSTTGGVAVDVANSSLSIDNLNDVDITSTPPVGGQSLVWNASNNEFEPGDPTVLSNKSLNSLQDVDLASNAPVTGQTLKWDGLKFVPANDDASGSLVPGSTHVINIQGDVSGSVYGDDSTLIIDGTDGKFKGVIDTTQSATFDTRGNLGDVVSLISDSGERSISVYSAIGGSNNSAGQITFYAFDGSYENRTPVSAGDIYGQINFGGSLLTAGGQTDDLHPAVINAKLEVASDGATTYPKSAIEMIVFNGTNIPADTVRAKFNADGVFSAPVIQPGTYADATARDAAITSPAAGMMVFVTDVAKFQGYDGSAWVNLN